MKIDYYHFSVIDSTNTWAKTNASFFRKDRVTIVTAGHQTAGRGRQGRHWYSPPGQNLYATYCLFFPKTRADLINIPQVVVTAAAKILDLQIKWPNDLMKNNKKLGGILGETTLVDDTICSINGLGINVNMPPEDLSAIDRPATSLKIIEGYDLDIERVSTELQDAICNDLKLFIEQGFAPILPDFKAHLVHQLGDSVSFHYNNGIIEGSFHSINDDGTLNLILDDTVQRFHSGELHTA